MLKYAFISVCSIAALIYSSDITRAGSFSILNPGSGHLENIKEVTTECVTGKEFAGNILSSGSNRGIKSSALGQHALPAPSFSRFRPSIRQPSRHVRWKRMQSKAFIQGNRMFLLSSTGKKYRAATGTYKLNNGKLVVVRNGLILPKANCK